MSTPLRDSDPRSAPNLLDNEQLVFGRTRIVGDTLADQLSDAHRSIALETTGVGVWSINLRTDELLVDKRAAHLWDLTGSGQRTVRDIVDRIHPDDRAEVQAAVRRSANPHAPEEYHQTYRLMHRDGVSRWVEVSARMVFEGEGEDRKAAWFLGTVRDVDSQLRMAEELRQSEARYRLVLDSVGLGTWSVDLLSGVTERDARAREVFGVPPDAPVEGSTLSLDALHDDDRARVEAALESAADPNHTGMYSEVFRIVVENGGVRWVESHGRVFFEGEGAERHGVWMLGTVRDVTRRVETQQALLHSEAHYRLALDAAELGTWSVDSEAGLFRLDPRGRDIFGLPPGADLDLSGTMDRVHPDDHPSVLLAAERAMDPSGNHIYEVAHRILCPDGTERWVEAKGRVFVDSDEREDQPVRFSGVVRDVTEQKTLEHALRESEEQVRVTLEGAQLGSWGLDPETGRVDADERARAMFGLRASEATTLAPFVDRMHPDDRERVAEAIERSLDPDPDLLDTYEVVYRVHPARDVERWVEARGQAIFEGEGAGRRAVRFTGILRDVTEQKLTEHALLDSESRLRMIFERIDEGYCLCEIIVENGTPVDYRFIEVNPLFEQMSGLHEPTGKTALEMVPELEPYWIETYGRVALEGESIRLEQGSEAMGRWFDVFATPVEPHGRFAVVFRDTTEQKKVERALRESEGRLRTIFERIDEGYSLCEIIVENGKPVDYRFIEVNPLFETMTGLQDAAGKTIHELVPGIESYWIETYGRVALEGESMRFEQRSEVMGRWFDVFATPVEPRGRFAIVFRDTTERHLAEKAVADREAELRALNGTLEARVVERTTQLEQRNRDLQDFAHAASHDLQEPLRKISIFAGMIAEDYADNMDEQGRYFIDRVQNAAQRLGVLVRDLLAYSRVSSRAADADEVDLASVAQTVLEDLEMAIRDSGAQIQIDALPTIQADSAQMHQLLQNLLENAVKYRHPDRSPKIRVWAETSDRTVDLMVEDDGIGIDPKHRERIFAPFGRLHGRSEYAGSGIGLAVCRRIAERHGGSIEVEGEVGEGSTFVVTLPIEGVG